MRKTCMSILLIMIISLVACGNDTSSSGNKDKININLSTLSAADSVVGEALNKFKEVVEEESDGQIEATVYANGQLASSDEQQMEILESGTADVLSTNPYIVASATGVNKLNVIDIPFLFDDNKEMYDLLDGETGQDILNEVSDAANVVPVGFYDLGWYVVGIGDKKVNSPDGFSGLKIRSTNSEIQTAALKAMGANPSPLAYGEVYTGLQQGTIDGVITSTQLIYEDKLYENTDYVALTRHIPLSHLLMMNKDFYEKLSDDLRAAVDKAGEESLEYARELALDREKVAIDGMTEEGVEVYELNEEEREVFRKETEGVAEKYMDKIGGEEFYNNIRNELGLN